MAGDIESVGRAEYEPQDKSSSLIIRSDLRSDKVRQKY